MLLLAAVASAAPSGSATPDRLAWFKEAKFGMFIHWGIYAVLGRGEWIMHNERIPKHEYEKLVSQFNPVRFNAREWARLAVEAGMRYVTFTTKHHDGFCMFDSALTDYDIMSTPFKRDVLAELVRAWREAGLRVMFYYSLLDWHHPHYVPRPKWQTDPPGHKRDFRKYLEYAFGQIRELCEKYRPDGIWFDGGWEHPAEEWHARELIETIRSIIPNAIVNNRARYDGDFDTPEQHIGQFRVDRPWESCITLGTQWAWKPNDRIKPPEECIRLLVECVGRGGNLLLNVGPKPDGTIQREFVARLRKIGAWMKVNGESIYGAEGTPFWPLPRWVDGCTVKGNKLYLHFFDWPTEPVVIEGLLNDVRRVYLLRDGADVPFKKQGDRLAFEPIPLLPDPYDTVVVVELVGPPKVDTAIRQAEDGTVILPARRANIHGATARYECGGGKDNIGFWTNPKDWVSWEFVVKRGGRFEVEITYACDRGTGGAEYVVEVDGRRLRGTVKETGSWTKFVTEKLGEISLPAGRFVLSVKPVRMPGYAVMNLKQIVLEPVEER